MEFLVTDVVKPLAAVSAILDAGKKVVFNKVGSFIRNLKMGEKVYPKRKRGAYAMKVSVDVVGEIGTDAGEGSGFIGQAQCRVLEGWMQEMQP